MPLTDYRTLGRSGLAVSPLALGTMTFGTARWGADEAVAGAILDAYFAEGGNLVDTADVYAGGRGEEMVGRLLAARGARDGVVLSTKAGFATGPRAGGNGAGHVRRSVEGSLRRLGTDRIDLWWAHVWDGATPAEELLATVGALVAEGKVIHWGLSNAPAWFVARVATLAERGAGPRPVAIQLFHSLVEREAEREHLPMAAELGLGLVPWSPLAYGLLTGKYDRAAVEAQGPRGAGLPDGAAGEGEGGGDRRRLAGANPFGDSLFTERNWGIVEAVRRVAGAIGEPMARVALAWVVGRPGVASTLIGASRPEQVRDNVAALDLRLPPGHRAALDAASAPSLGALYDLFRSPLRDAAVFGGAAVAPWRRAA